MPDYQTTPALTDTYTNVLTNIKDKDNALAKMDYTGYTNLPVGTIRSNSSNSYKLERWTGSAWEVLTAQATIDSHIADTTIHQTPHVGAIEMIAYDTPDTGWLLCNGQAVARNGTYNALFQKIGTKYGAGDGSSTFNVPDLRARIPIGKHPDITTPTDISQLGMARGSLDHTHTAPTHTHTIATHSHGMNNHTHQVGAHAHPIGAHQHYVPGHYHSTQSAGADIRVISSGSHQHTEDDLRSQGYSSGGLSATAWSTSGTLTSQVIDSTSSNHVHDNTDFRGRVGLVTGGANGDDGTLEVGPAFGAGASSTSQSTVFYTSAPYNSTSTGLDNTTEGSGTLTTDAPSYSAGSNTTANNPPVLVFNFQIKF